MNKYIKQVLFVVFLILLTSCSAEYTELQILSTVVPKSDTECTIDAKSNEWSFFSEGVLDFNLKNLAKKTGYDVTLKIQNNSTEGTKDGIIYNNAIIDKIQVSSYFINTDPSLKLEILIAEENFYSDITVSAGTFSVVSFTALAPSNYFIRDEENELDGLQSYAESVIDMASTRLKLKIKIFAHNIAGSNLESNTFEYYVKLCNKCLFAYTSCPSKTVLTSSLCDATQDVSASCVSTEE